MVRFSIRDVLWLTVVVAMGCGRSVLDKAQDDPQIKQSMKEIGDSLREAAGTKAADSPEKSSRAKGP